MIRMVVQFLILILLLGVVPFLAGSLLLRPETKEGRNPIYCWVSGQMLSDDMCTLDPGLAEG